MCRRPAVIFDMDGVLVETEPIYVEICQYIFEQSGAVITGQRLLEYVGIPARRMWSELRDEYNLAYSVDELIQHEKSEQQSRFVGMEKIPVVPGVTDLIDKLHRSQIAMGVASSSSRDIIRILLTRTNLLRYFDAGFRSRAAQASINISGAGFPFLTSSPETTASK